MFVMWRVLYNLYSHTSEPDKLKVGSFRVFVKPRTKKEMLEILFGKNPKLVDYLFPTVQY